MVQTSGPEAANGKMEVKFRIMNDMTGPLCPEALNKMIEALESIKQYHLLSHSKQRALVQTILDFMFHFIKNMNCSFTSVTFAVEIILIGM